MPITEQSRCLVYVLIAGTMRRIKPESSTVMIMAVVTLRISSRRATCSFIFTAPPFVVKLALPLAAMVSTPHFRNCRSYCNHPTLSGIPKDNQVEASMTLASV